MISTPFTRAFNVKTPICLAPMAGISGGRLAAAVARGGGLGIIGVGSGKDSEMVSREVGLFRAEAPVGSRLGIGLISWMAFGKSSCDVSVLERILEAHSPEIVWLFAPATPGQEAYDVCRHRGVEVFAQVGTVADARLAVNMGASCVVAQGREAGGHGLRPELCMGTMTLAAAVAVELSETSIPVLAAGGITDGNGVVAALALGCHGAVMGTRYCVTDEALGSDDHKEKMVATSGDQTIRTRVFDMAAAARPVRPVDWPMPYDSSGVARNSFTERWHGKEDQLGQELAMRDSNGYSDSTAELEEAEGSRNLDIARVYMGEGVGLIYSVDPAENVTRKIAKELEEGLTTLNRLRMHFPPLHLPDTTSSISGAGASPGAPGATGQKSRLGSPVSRSSTAAMSPTNSNGTTSPLAPPTTVTTAAGGGGIDWNDRGGVAVAVGGGPGAGLVKGSSRKRAGSGMGFGLLGSGARQLVSSGSPYESIAGYSRAVRVGRHIMVSGTTATNPDGPGVVCPGNAGGQAAYIFVVIALALQEAGSAMEHVTRTRMYVTRASDSEAVMAEHERVFKSIRPAATIVVVNALVHPDLLVEIEADAQEAKG